MAETSGIDGTQFTPPTGDERSIAHCLLQIPVIQDLKVGYNLQDHICMASAVFIVDKPYGFVISRLENIKTAAKWVLYGEGLISSGSLIKSFYSLHEEDIVKTYFQRKGH